MKAMNQLSSRQTPLPALPRLNNRRLVTHESRVDQPFASLLVPDILFDFQGQVFDLDAVCGVADGAVLVLHVG